MPESYAGPERRKRGRKPLVKGQRGESLTAWLPTSVYDDACLLATRRGITLSAVARLAIMRMLRRELPTE